MIRTGLILSLFCAFAAGNLPAAEAPVYPTPDWKVVPPADAGWNPAALKAWQDFTFSNDQGHVTDAALVVHRGRVVFEFYANDYDPLSRHVGWSVTKSIWTTLFGIAESKGILSRTDPVTKYFPEKKGSAWEGVNLEHLLSMTTGIESSEGYQFSPFRSDIVAALYRMPWLMDKGGYRLRSNERVASPGTRFAYTSGDTNLLSAAMKKAMPDADYAAFPERELFTPIGAGSFVIERDHAGVFTGSSYGYASLRDFGRFGYLYLRNGKWGSKQIVPEAWVKDAQAPSSAYSTLRLDHRPMEAYSNGWWLNRPVPTAQFGKVLNSAPSDLYWAEGHEGQYIFVVPSLDLVVVRLGLDRSKDALDRDRFFKLLLAAYPGGSK